MSKDTEALVTSAVNESGDDKALLIKNLISLLEAQEAEAHYAGFQDALEFVEYDGDTDELFDCWLEGLSIDELDLACDDLDLEYGDVDEDFEDEE